MVPVHNYKDFWAYIFSQIPQISALYCVDDESELSKKIEQVLDKAIFLVAVYPSSDFQAMDEDNYGDVDTCVVYVLQKINPRNVTEEDVDTERRTTQEIMKQVRQLMLDLQGQWDGQTDQSRLMKQLIRGKQHVDRERNYFGCNGYSLSFGLRSNGL